MQTTPLDHFYLSKEEPLRGCLVALRYIILSQHAAITAEWKYGLPFFYFRGKMYCYLWIHKKYKLPYIGFVQGNRLEDPLLLLEKRAKIKILLIDPNEDIPIKKVNELLQKALLFCNQETINTH